VLGWQANEVAEAFGQTIPSVKSALYRARTTMARHQQTLHPETMTGRISDVELKELLERYTQAWEAGDVEAFVALLREDSTFSMPPTPSWYRGREEIGELVGKTIFSGDARGRWRLSPVSANAQPGFGLYRLDESSGNYVGYGIQVIALAGDRIGDITTFRNPALVEVFSLPQSFAAF
jgi:RNA polymerase sigma-70 factor (ECF subfamily)